MYELRKPASDLERFVENYWFVTPERGPVDLRVDVFVDGRPDLILNAGAPYARERIGGETVEVSSSNLDAQRAYPIRILQRGLVRIAGVRFRLGGLGPFVAGDLRRFTGSTPSPEAVFGPDASALERAVVDAEPDEAARAFDRFFLARLALDDGRRAFERALAGLYAGGSCRSVEEVAAEVGVSARQLDRLFARHLGLPPRTVGRILRFQASLRALMRDPGVPLADVASAVGYFDQAHFVREFKQMTGGVPRGYRGYYPPHSPSDFAPNVVAFVQDGPGPRVRR